MEPKGPNPTDNNVELVVRQGKRLRDIECRGEELLRDQRAAIYGETKEITAKVCVDGGSDQPRVLGHGGKSAMVRVRPVEYRDTAEARDGTSGIGW